MLPYPNEAYEPLIVFSVPTAKDADAVTEYMTQHNLPFKPVIGSWCGEPRDYSFVAHATAFGPLIFNGYLDGSESVLYLHPSRTSDGSRRAELVSVKGHALTQPAIEYGRWVRVSEAGARSKPGWTYDPADSAWYTCIMIPKGNEVPAHRLVQEAA
jgi:hypothetical protein